MNADDWGQAQSADPVLSLMIARMQDGILSWSPYKPTELPEFCTFLQECNHLKLRWGILYRKLLPKDSQEAQFQLVLLATHWEATLRGCHNEVDHLGLECMLDLMCNHFFWPWMASQAKEHIEGCCWCVTFKAKQQQASLENIVATHPLELVHMDYLCLELGKGNEEDVLVVTDHPLCPSICHPIPDGPGNGQGPLGKLHSPLWVT